MSDSPQLKIIALGGFGEVNTNMFVYETDNDMILVDCGIGFPSEDMPGVDVLIPDISYLQGKMHKIRGLVITHGHEDHIGGLPYILPKLPNIPVYAANLPAKLIQEKLSEYQNMPKNIIVLPQRQPIQLGSFTVESIHVTHSIPESTHLFITSPAGKIYHGSDFKFDFTPVYKDFSDLQRIGQIGAGGVDLMLSDCLGSERQGYTPSETTLDSTFDRELRDCPGKFIVTSIGGNISRWYQAARAAIKHGRKIAVSGRSVDKNLAIARQLGYFDIPKEYIIDVRQVQKLPPSQVCLLVAGSQGQKGSALDRIASGDHHFIELVPQDKVVFSSDYIPGTESSVNSLINELSAKGITVIYTAITDHLHVSGHGSQQDLLLLLSLLRPAYALPFGGNFNHMVQYAKLVKNADYAEDRVILPKEYQAVILKDHQVSLGEIVPSRNIMVDGLGVGDVGAVVLRDRQHLAEEGVVVALVELDKNDFSHITNLELLSRGFVFDKQNANLLNQASQEIRHAFAKKQGKIESERYVRNLVSEVLEKFFFIQTRRNPMILPVVVSV